MCVCVCACVCGGGEAIIWSILYTDFFFWGGGDGGWGGGGLNTTGIFLLLVRPGKVELGHPSFSLKCFLNNRLCCSAFCLC